MNLFIFRQQATILLFVLAFLPVVTFSSAYFLNPSFKNNLTLLDTSVYRENNYVSASVSVISDGWNTPEIRSNRLYVYGN